MDEEARIKKAQQQALGGAARYEYSINSPEFDRALLEAYAGQSLLNDAEYMFLNQLLDEPELQDVLLPVTPFFSAVRELAGEDNRNVLVSDLALYKRDASSLAEYRYGLHRLPDERVSEGEYARFAQITWQVETLLAETGTDHMHPYLADAIDGFAQLVAEPGLPSEENMAQAQWHLDSSMRSHEYFSR